MEDTSEQFTEVKMANNIRKTVKGTNSQENVN